MISKNVSFHLWCTDYTWKWLPLFCKHISARFKRNLFPFFDNFVSLPHAVSGLDDWLQSCSNAQNVETLQNDHSNVTVDNRACFSTAIFKLKVTYIITSWNLAHLLRNTLCALLYNVWRLMIVWRWIMELKICIKKLPARNLEYYFNVFVEELKKVAKIFRIFGVSGNIRISSFQNIKEQLHSGIKILVGVALRDSILLPHVPS